MTNYPPFGTPEYQEYLRKEQEKHNASMEAARQFHEKYLTTLKKQLQVDLQKFSNQELQKGITELQRNFNEGIEFFLGKVDGLSTKYGQGRSNAKIMYIKLLEIQIQTHIEAHIKQCQFLFKNSNQPVDTDLIRKIETIGNTLIAHANAKKDE